jgi:hypothetical protein
MVGPDAESQENDGFETESSEPIFEDPGADAVREAETPSENNIDLDKIIDVPKDPEPKQDKGGAEKNPQRVTEPAITQKAGVHAPACESKQKATGGIDIESLLSQFK